MPSNQLLKLHNAEMWNSPERFTAPEWTDRGLLGFVYYVQIK